MIAGRKLHNLDPETRDALSQKINEFTNINKIFNMSQKKKLYVSTKVNLDQKLDEEDSFRPSTTAAATGIDFNFEIQNSSSKVKPNSMHAIRNIFDGKH